MIKKWINKEPRFNYYIFGLVVAIALFGVFVILSASANLTIKYDTSQSFYAGRQAFFMVIGTLLMIITSFIDYRLFKKYANLIWIASIILILMSLFSPLRVLYNGYARRGLKLGFTFMPSDIYKIGAILFISKFLVRNKKYEDNLIKGFLKTVLLIGIPTMLVLIQPDLSTSLAIFATLGTIYLIGGFKKKYLPYLLVIAIIGGILFLFKGNAYQMDRIKGWLDPEKYSNGISWHIINSLFAVTRGGLFGVGYGKSVLKFGYLSDEVYNDMIFAVIAEEFGFMGSVLFMIAIFGLYLLLIKEALKAKDLFAKYVLVGIASIYLYQSIINIGVATNIIPNTGITLPFISFGGTSMLVFFFMFGIVLNITRHNNMQEDQAIKQNPRRRN